MKHHLLCLLFSLPVLTSAQSPRVKSDLVFATVDEQALKLDLYLPAATNAPLVVYIHGGGWKGGSKNKPAIQWVVDEGYALASISYRLTDVAIFPAQIHDCKAALRWLRANAATYGYQSEKIVVAGSSAGGQLAALLGSSGELEALEGSVGGNLDHSSRVQGVIDYYGATDFVLRSRTQPSRANEPGSVVHRLLGGAASDKVELAKLASAAFHVTPDDPPFLVFHGNQDKTVLPDQSERIHEVYTAAGLPIDLQILKGEGHGGKAFYSGDSRDRALAFLNRILR